MTESGILHAEKLMMHRRALLDLVNQIPENQIGFSPWDGGMNFKEMVDHLVESSDRLMKLISKEHTDQKPSAQTWSESVDRLKSNTNTLSHCLSALTQEDLYSTVQAFGGRTMTVAACIDFLRAHEAHHKGQIWQMARMVGVKPPLFISIE